MRPRPTLIVLLLATACASGPEADLSAGRAALDRGDYVQAAARLEAALAKPQPLDQRYQTLVELGELYLTYVDLAREERAGELFTSALELTEANLPAGHPAHLASLDRRARYQGLKQQWTGVRALLELYMALAQRSIDPETLYGSQAAGLLLEAYNRLDAREEYEALRARRREPLYFAMKEGTAVEEFSDAELCAGPNTRDARGRPAWARFSRDDMPLRVFVGVPDTAAKASSIEATAEAARGGIAVWQTSLRRLLPWFEIRFVGPGEPADVTVEFKRRGRYYLPAVGEIRLTPEGRTTGHVTLAPQPIPNGDHRVAPGELAIWATHAFGSALGLADCWHEDSVMSVNWRRGARFQVSDRDIRAFQALLARENGKTAPDAPGADDAGVLADLPMINSGDGADVLVDLAPPGSRSLPLQLDTGATDTVLSTDYARALGISVRRIKSDAYRRPTVTGDPLRFWITAQGGGTDSRHFDYALLGGEYLRSYVLDLDFTRRRVRLLDPAVHDLTRAGGRLPGERLIPIEIRGKWVFAELGLGNGSVWGLVDTGAQSHISITEEKAAQLGIRIDPNAERRHFLNVFGSSVDFRQPLAEARLGGIAVRDTWVEISSRSESSVRVMRWLPDETIIGLLVLQRFRVRIDYPHGAMGLTPIGEDAR